MGLKNYRPLTPSLRWTILPDFSEVTKHKPETKLTWAKRKTGGRNNLGRMTARGIGGGHKRRHRVIDFKRDKIGMEATVEAIEYDPNRSARIALLKYKDGEKRYILAPIGLAVGAKVMSGPDAELAVGNALPLRKIIPGMPIHNIELHRGRGGQICRSAGMAAQITASEGEFVTVKMPSGEVRLISRECFATIGQVGNTDHMNVSLGKAGRTRWLGHRGISRGMARNPVDHPMGGGQGKSKGGGGWHHPCSPWGKLAKGGKSRRKKKYSDTFILQRRKK
ncbi:MAG TPA: 50S ribosomal protein L2 [Verrucomicrobiae bacterium]|nr:50S ribosomal protein L2 [Verrucomicrobiae bacterium]